jgi:hypothetical protein
MNPLAAALSVLMVGHSLFGPDGADMLQEALRAGTGEGTVQAQIINGAPLGWNWEHSAEAEGVDARAVLPKGEVTHLILTEAIPLANHLQWSNTEVNARNFADLALSANPEAKVYLQETWHSLKSGTGEAVEYDAGADVPWRERLAQDLPAWEGIVSAMAEGGAPVELIPAGQAMGLLHDRIAAGEVEGVEDISALFADDIHLNDAGHYFVAMVQYAVLTGQDPLGLPTDFNDRWGQAFATPPEDLSRALQRVAWDAVQAYSARVADRPVAPARDATAPAAPTGPPEAEPGAPAATKKAASTASPEPVRTPEATAQGTRDVAIGLAAVADWSTEVPFMDLMKSSRPWIGHLPGRFGGMETAELAAGGYLDDNGWPLRMPAELGSIGTLFLTDMLEAAVSLRGRYLLGYEGDGIIEVTGRASNVRYGEGEVRFDYTPGPGAVEIRIQRINVTDPLRNITVVREDHLAAFAEGAVFNPDWIRRIEGFEGLRFMDWMATNDSTLDAWEDRPQVADVTWAGGVPVEIMVQLANEVGADPWFTLPHLADDTFVRSFAEYVRENLDPARKVYAEFSNEVWNWQFAQARWADERAQSRWGEADKWVQYYALRAAEVARIWTEVFGPQAEARLVNVISTQTGWIGLEEDILNAPLVMAEGLPVPAEAFDAYAVSGYFAGTLGMDTSRSLIADWLTESLVQARAGAEAAGLEGEAAKAHVAARRFDFAVDMAAREALDGTITGSQQDTLADLTTRVWPHHAAVAREHGLDLVMYEGGTHATGIGPMADDAALTEFLHHFNYSDAMGKLYTTLLEGWEAVGGQLFNAYADVYAPTKWGAWGGLRHLDDNNPRWDALVGFR